jgi:hypothetical protein
MKTQTRIGLAAAGGMEDWKGGRLGGWGARLRASFRLPILPIFQYSPPLLLTLALTLGLAPRAGAAGYEMPITFGGYTNRTEALTNFPVLVVFSNGIGSSGFSFSSHPFVTTNGYDLRFYTNTTDTGDGLNYEIESWNTNAASHVWVRVPLIPTNGLGSIYAKWGDTAASNQLACTTNGAVWTNGFAGVWHMAEPTGTTNRDSSGWGNNGTPQNSPVQTNAAIGKGLNFNGTSQYITVPASASLGVTSPYTISGWLNMTTIRSYNPVVFRGSGTANDIELYSANNPFGIVTTHNRSNGGTLAQNTSGQWGNFPTAAWTHFALTFSSGTWKLYKNGIQANTLAGKASPLNLNSWRIGYVNQTAFGGTYYFGGAMDEIRISSVADSSNWVWACWLNGVSNTLFNTYGTASSAALATSPQIQNRTASGVTTNGATFNGSLVPTAHQPQRSMWPGDRPTAR